MNAVGKVAISAVIVLFASGASAASITFGGVMTANDGLTSSREDATVINFNDGNKPSNYSGDGGVLNGSLSGYYAAPAGDSSNYLSVAYPKSSGTESAGFSSGYNYFGLYWGSMDDYNTLSFYRNSALIGSVTGAQVIAAGTALGDQIAAGSNRYVNIDFGDLYFDKVEFATGGYAFESDNHAYGVVGVPEPGSVLLLGAGLTGIALSRRRKAAIK